MKLYVYHTKKYKKSLRKIIKKGRLDIREVDFVVNKITKGEKLDRKYRDHKLKGDLAGYRECHIQPDILLVYEIKESLLILSLINIGSHSDLFE
jgi:mRNA interferase YafQ